MCTRFNSRRADNPLARPFLAASVSTFRATVENRSRGAESIHDRVDRELPTRFACGTAPAEGVRREGGGGGGRRRRDRTKSANVRDDEKNLIARMRSRRSSRCARKIGRGGGREREREREVIDIVRAFSCIHCSALNRYSP